MNRENEHLEFFDLVPSEMLVLFIWNKKIAQVVVSNDSLEGSHELISAALRKINADGYIHVIGIIQIAFLQHKFMCLKTYFLLNLYLLTFMPNSIIRALGEKSLYI